MENINIFAILPESIGGRLTMNSLYNGFAAIGCNVEIYDRLKEDYAPQKEKYDFVIGYDYDAIELKEKHKLNSKIVNYFSDAINSDFSGKNWQKHFEKLKNDDCHTFYWDKEHYKILKDDIKNLFYLPHAVDVDIYKNLNLPDEYDVMFAGRLTHEGRLERFITLVKSLPDVKFALFCHPNHLKNNLNELNAQDAKLLESIYKGFIDTEDAMSEAINKAKMVINYNNQGISSLNYRTFQVMACEKLLISDNRKELFTLLQPEKELLYYNNDSEMKDKIQYVLNNPEISAQIGKRARIRISENFDCKKAAEFILKTVIK